MHFSIAKLEQCWLLNVFGRNMATTIKTFGGNMLYAHFAVPVVINEAKNDSGFIK